jgi:hypothetical protein
VAAALTTIREPVEIVAEPPLTSRGPRPSDQTFPMPFIR